MGHGVPTMIGVDHKGVASQITSLVPDYMVMGDKGMAEMGSMEMPLPDNTLPMMTGEGPFGSVEMGGMFSVLKVRRDQKPGDYGNPGWYKHPAGSNAFEWTGSLPDPARFAAEGGQAMPLQRRPARDLELQIRKPGSDHSHH